MFTGDFIEVDKAIRDAVQGARILAVGAVGSIGSNTVHTLV